MGVEQRPDVGLIEPQRIIPAPNWDDVVEVSSGRGDWRAAPAGADNVLMGSPPALTEYDPVVVIASLVGSGA